MQNILAYLNCYKTKLRIRNCVSISAPLSSVSRWVALIKSTSFYKKRMNRRKMSRINGQDASRVSEPLKTVIPNRVQYPLKISHWKPFAKLASEAIKKGAIVSTFFVLACKCHSLFWRAQNAVTRNSAAATVGNDGPSFYQITSLVNFCLMFFLFILSSKFWTEMEIAWNVVGEGNFKSYDRE